MHHARRRAANYVKSSPTSSHRKGRCRARHGSGMPARRCRAPQFRLSQDQHHGWRRRLERIQRVVRRQGPHRFDREPGAGDGRQGPARLRGDQRPSAGDPAPGERRRGSASDRRDRERASRHQGESARHPGLRAIWRPGPRADSPLLVPLRHLSGRLARGDADRAGPNPGRRRRLGSGSGRDRLHRAQDQRPHPGRHAAPARAGLRPRRELPGAERRARVSRRDSRPARGVSRRRRPRRRHHGGPQLQL